MRISDLSSDVCSSDLNDQSGFLQDYLAKPFEFDNQDAANWSYDLASQRILPQQQQNEDALRSRLVNSGIRPGTEAWDREMPRLTNANNDQLTPLALPGRGQARSAERRGGKAGVGQVRARGTPYTQQKKH